MGIKKKRSKHLDLFICIVFLTQQVQAAPPLRIAGSSAVFPFAATVGEHFSHKTHEPIPLIEAIGTGAGIKLFCGNLNGPDGVITSRPLTEGEKEKCNSQGITFEEFKIGQDGLILIQNKRGIPFSLTLGDLNSALAEKILQGKVCIKNPHKTWNDIQKDFPIYPIRVYGPAPTSGTYDVLIEKIMRACGASLRHDGVYIEAPANENLIVQKVLNTPQTIGIVTFSFYDQNKTRLHALPIDGMLPSISSIQKGNYPLSRPLYLYVKTNNIKGVPSRAAYVLEFISQDAIGVRGYLNEKGLIPLSSVEQEVMHKRALNLQSGESSK
jgi:phosphate transport system substrate-binding protein